MTKESNVGVGCGEREEGKGERRRVKGREESGKQRATRKIGFSFHLIATSRHNSVLDVASPQRGVSRALASVTRGSTQHYDGVSQHSHCALADSRLMRAVNCRQGVIPAYGSQMAAELVMAAPWPCSVPVMLTPPPLAKVVGIGSHMRTHMSTFRRYFQINPRVIETLRLDPLPPAPTRAALVARLHSVMRTPSSLTIHCSSRRLANSRCTYYSEAVDAR